MYQEKCEVKIGTGSYHGLSHEDGITDTMLPLESDVSQS